MPGSAVGSTTGAPPCGVAVTMTIAGVSVGLCAVTPAIGEAISINASAVKPKTVSKRESFKAILRDKFTKSTLPAYKSYLCFPKSIAA